MTLNVNTFQMQEKYKNHTGYVIVRIYIDESKCFKRKRLRECTINFLLR